MHSHHSLTYRSICTYIILLSILLFAYKNSQAKTIQDFGIWTNISITGGFGFISPDAKKFRYYLSNRTNFMDDASRLSQNRLLLGLGYAINDNWTFMGGWGDSYSTYPYEKTGSRMSDRLWQQAYWQEQFTYYTLSSRTRLEERLIQGQSQVHWRARQLVEIIIPLEFIPKLGFVLNDEVFWNLNKVSSNNEFGINGFAQNRFFAGFQYQLTNYLHVDLGYMNQFIRMLYDDNSYMGNAIYFGVALVLP